MDESKIGNGNANGHHRSQQPISAAAMAAMAALPRWRGNARGFDWGEIKSKSRIFVIMIEVFTVYHRLFFIRYIIVKVYTNKLTFFLVF